jgi:non-ribosomal peptide synthetase component E (peptide arylation enzyme)
MSADRVIRRLHDDADAARFVADGLWGEQTFAEIVDGWAAAGGEKLAIADQTVRWSYAELRDISLRLASVFVDLGVQPGDPVVVQIPSSAWLPAVHLAANRVGAIFVPMSATWRHSEMSRLLPTVDPRVIILPRANNEFDHADVVSGLRHQLPSLAAVLMLDLAGPLPPDADDEAGVTALVAAAEPISAEEQSRRRTGPNAPSHVMCSSGTTGTPKASIWSDNNLLALLERQYASAIELVRSDKAAGLAPADTGSTGYGFPVVAPLLVGASGVLLEKWSPAAALELIIQERCTVATAIPTQMVMLLDLDLEAADLSSFTRFHNAGAPLASHTAEAIETRMGCLVQTVYGATDGGIPTMTSITDPDDARRSSIGPGLPGEELRLVDSEGRDVAAGQPGELWWRGANKSYGYLNQPDYDELVWDQDGWYHSGDLGQVRDDGYVRIVGRTKDMILRGGTNIFPKEIEELLLQHPAVSAVAVVGVPDERLGEQAVAVVVAASGQTVTLTDLTSLLTEKGLAKVKLPEHLILVAELAVNTGAKVDRSAIQLEAAIALGRSVESGEGSA